MLRRCAPTQSLCRMAAIAPPVAAAKDGVRRNYRSTIEGRWWSSRFSPFAREPARYAQAPAASDGLIASPVGGSISCYAARGLLPPACPLCGHLTRKVLRYSMCGGELPLG